MSDPHQHIFDPHITLQIDRCGVAAADQDAYPLSWLWLVAPRQKGREGGCAAGFGDHPQHFPQCALGLLDGFVGNQQHTLHMRLGDGEHEFANSLRGQRVSGDSSRFGVNRPSRL